MAKAASPESLAHAQVRIPKPVSPTNLGKNFPKLCSDEVTVASPLQGDGKGWQAEKAASSAHGHCKNPTTL